jgi:hypothetical protein
MGTLQVDKDRPDLQRLEDIVKHCKSVGTAALSLESSISPEHESKKQENQLERQRHQSRVRPF